MTRLQKLAIALAALAACVVVGGVAYAASSGTNQAKSPSAKNIPVAHTQPRAHSKARSSARSRSASPARRARESNAGDPDNIQSGDQTSPDANGAATAAAAPIRPARRAHPRAHLRHRRQAMVRVATKTRPETWKTRAKQRNSRPAVAP